MVLECSDLSLCLIYQNSEKKYKEILGQNCKSQIKKIPVFRVTRLS